MCPFFFTQNLIHDGKKTVHLSLRQAYRQRNQKTRISGNGFPSVRPIKRSPASPASQTHIIKRLNSKHPVYFLKPLSYNHPVYSSFQKSKPSAAATCGKKTRVPIAINKQNKGGCNMRGRNINRGKYRIGETYWAKNPKAGRNTQSCGILVGWTGDGKAILENKRWGTIYATIANLNKHN